MLDQDFAPGSFHAKRWACSFSDGGQALSSFAGGRNPMPLEVPHPEAWDVRYCRRHFKRPVHKMAILDGQGHSAEAAYAAKNDAQRQGTCQGFPCGGVVSGRKAPRGRRPGCLSPCVQLPAG